MNACLTSVFGINVLLTICQRSLLVASQAPDSMYLNLPAETVFRGHCDSFNRCHHECINLAEGGYHCECHPGYYLHDNGFSCMDEGATASALDDEVKAGHSVRDSKGPKSDIFDSLIDDDDELDEKIKDQDEETLASMLDENYLLKLQRRDGLDMMMGDAPIHSDNDDDDMGVTNEVDSTESEIENLVTPEKRQLMYSQDENASNNSTSDDTSRGRNRNRNRNKDGRRKSRKNKNRKGSKKGKSRGDRQRIDINDSQQADSRSPGNDVLYEEEQESRSQIQEQYSNFNSCLDLHCQSGGHCVADTMREGVKCQCPLGSSGLHCEQDLVVKYPQFRGTGYMTFPVLRRAFRAFKITIEFRPDTPNGLLLFSAEHPTARADFFSISLVDSMAEFRFDCGTGSAILKTQNRINLQEWNTINVERTESSGWIVLNNGKQIKGRSKGLFRMVTFRESLYLGGYSNTTLIGRRTGMRWGFVGCVRHLEVNNKVYDMRKGAFVGDALGGMDVGECSANVCDNTQCLNGGTCAAGSADTALCLCGIGYSGDRCERAIDIYVPEFSGSSYLQHLGLRRSVLGYAKIEVVFKPTDPDGLIFYNGYSTDKTGDFVSIALKDGYLEFRFDLGTGAAILRSREKLEMGIWHDVVCLRNGRRGDLHVDDEAAVQGVSKGTYTQLTLSLDLFIGGHRNFDEVAKNAAISKSFKGCIQKIIVNDKPVELIDAAREGANVGTCDHTCATIPCENGGVCFPAMDSFTCQCTIGYSGERCETATVSNNTVTLTETIPEIREQITTPMFTGNSYMMFVDQDMMTRTRGNKFAMQMRIRTNQPNGLLFWTSSKSRGDFVAIGLSNGYAMFRFNLGSGAVTIEHDGSRLNDGVWHTIKAERYNKTGYLEVDELGVVERTSPGHLVQLVTRPEIYIGGMPNVGVETDGYFINGFFGCIANVTLGTDYKVDLNGEFAESKNVKQCT